MPNQGKREHRSFSEFDNMSTAALLRILQSDSQLPETAHDNTEAVLYITKILAEREKTSPEQHVPDVNTAWDSFQRVYRPDHNDGKSLYDFDALTEQSASEAKRPKINTARRDSVLRKVGIIAATIAILFGCMFAAQAAGADVFGTLAGWTDDVFYFNKAEDSTEPTECFSAPAQNEMQAAAAALGMNCSYVPTWVPEGYTLLDIAEERTDLSLGIYAVYKKGNSYINIDVTKCDSALIHGTDIMKDEGAPEEYTSNGRLFYLFTNTGKWAGAWSGDNYIIILGGFPSKSLLIKTIESIGGTANE